MAAVEQRVNLLPRGPAGVLRALKWSLLGLKAAFIRDESFRLWLLVWAVFTPLAFVFGETPVERALLAGVLLLILIAELYNSALEVVFDRYGNDHHPLTGLGKDIGSAAVLLSAILALVVWALILLG